MNVTRDVMTDLLPVYFSGEASEDTKRLMEEYFRENPEFEQIARRAATPLETLRKTAPVAADAEREKYELQWVREEVFRRRLAFGLALVFTTAPLMTIYSKGHLVWGAFLNNPWELIFFWSMGALSWFQCFSGLSRRASAMVWGILFALLPVACAFHLFLPGWQTGLRGRLGVAAVMWVGAIVIWANYLRLRSVARKSGKR
jgi:hypothetical protein